MKYLYYTAIICTLLFSQSSISTESLDFNKWLKNDKFTFDLNNKIEHLLSFKNLSKTNKNENIKDIQIQIISYLNTITEYQYEYIKLRSLCSNKISVIN